MKKFLTNKYKSRDEILKSKLVTLLNDNKKVEGVIECLKEYESANLITIDKLSRIKKLDIKKISGALKQCIQAHGSITENYIPSAAKRIYGSIMLEDNCVPDNVKPFSIRGIILGMLIYGIIHLIIHLI